MAIVEAQMDAAAQATAEAVAATANEINRIEGIAENAIENAEARVEAAQELAQQLTDAALQTEIGRQVADIREEIETCRQGNLETQTKVTLLETMLTEATTQITALVLQLANLSPLIQPAPLVIPATAEAAEILPDQPIALVSPQQDASAENTAQGEAAPLEIRRKKKFV